VRVYLFSRKTTDASLWLMMYATSCLIVQKRLLLLLLLFTFGEEV